MATYQSLLLSFPDSPTFFETASDAYNFESRFENHLAGMASGAKLGSVQCQQVNNDAVAASGTFTISSGAATDTAVTAGTTLTCVDHRETTNVTYADDSSGSLNSTFFTFQSQAGTHKYYVWFNINSAGVDPAPAGHGTGIMVAGATNATADTLALATVAACASVVGVIVAHGSSGHVIFTDTAPGVATKVTDGSAATSFTFTRSITGSAVTSAQYQVGTTDTLTAAALAAAMNANTTIHKYVSATSALGVVTVTALVAGVIGNLITTTASGNVTASGSKLTGGANDTGSANPVVTYHYGY